MSVQGKQSQANSLIYLSLTCGLQLLLYRLRNWLWDLHTLSLIQCLKKPISKSVHLFSAFSLSFPDPTTYTSCLQTQPEVLDLLHAIYCFLLYFILEFTHICLLKNILERSITFFVGLVKIFPVKLLQSKVVFLLIRKDVLHKARFCFLLANAWELCIEISVPAVVTLIPSVPF